MYVETVYSASSDNQTVSVKVTEQMETKNDAKIQAMKDVISAFVLPGQQGIMSSGVISSATFAACMRFNVSGTKPLLKRTLLFIIGPFV